MKNLLIGLALMVAGYALIILGMAAVVGAIGCGTGAPSKTDITCQSGQGTCYVVHCEARDSHECISYFHKFCSKDFDFKTYGIITNTQHDYLLECK